MRAYRDLDTRAASFEAGRYLDTIGFASFSLSPPPSVASSSAAAAATFAHLNIDANRASMAAAAGLADPASLLTAAGAALRGEIKRASGLRLRTPPQPCARLRATHVQGGCGAGRGRVTLAALLGRGDAADRIRR